MKPRALTIAVFALALCASVPVTARPAATQIVPEQTVPEPQAAVLGANYVVGPQDVLIITSYDQPDLTGTFTVEIDGTFTYPLIGRLRVGGMTLREVEATLKKELVDQGFFRDPEVTVAIEQYRSQRIYVVGEVRAPGAYPMSGDMRLVEALALAGSTLPTASGEAVIMRPSDEALVLESTPNSAASTGQPAEQPNNVVRVDLSALENGDLSQNVALTNGDTIFVLRAESVYVFGQVRNPGAYPLRQRNTTVLQALSLAGGVTDRGSTGRIQIVRIVDGVREEIRAELTDIVLPRDTIVVPERFF